MVIEDSVASAYLRWHSFDVLFTIHQNIEGLADCALGLD